MGGMKYRKLQNCPKFKRLSVPERLEMVKEHGLCSVALDGIGPTSVGPRNNLELKVALNCITNGCTD